MIVCIRACVCMYVSVHLCVCLRVCVCEFMFMEGRRVCVNAASA